VVVRRSRRRRRDGEGNWNRMIAIILRVEINPSSLSNRLSLLREAIRDPGLTRLIDAN